MTINANTKIAKILKENPQALEAIVSIDSKFEKLRNPVLRKLMAGRTSIGMAAKISGCGVQAFFDKLAPLGFEIEILNEDSSSEKTKPAPDFLKNISSSQIIALDVRPIIDEGKDPLSIIIAKVKEVPKGGILKITNSFEPTPLLSLLAKQGFEHFVEKINERQVDTYFYKKENKQTAIPETEDDGEDWESYLKKYENRIEYIDVKSLEMPGPMMKILSSLETLPSDFGLYVYHKRIPVFLLPELREKGFDYRIHEIADGNVHLFIFKE